MKPYRVRFWLENEDGREECMYCDSIEQAMEFYDSQDGKSEIQQYDEERHCYETILFPTFEF